MMFDDVMELKKRFGSTAAELGIKEAFFLSYKAKGKFFGQNCDCCLYFDGNNLFTDYDIYVDGDKNSNPNDLINDMCSGPVSSNMTPYVESNGGAVYTCVYEDKDALIAVSKAQKQKYYRINVKPNPNPGYVGTLTLKPAGTKGFFPKGVEANPAKYDHGILTVRVTNHTEEPLELSDEFTLFERRESSYYSKFKISLPFSPAVTYPVLPGGTADIKLDLRRFGKATPNEYMVEFSGIQLYFVLADSSVSEKS